jgi:hypothetical protein
VRGAGLKRFGKNLAMPPTDRREDAPEGDVLSALPRTRPQRRSARRATPPKAEPAAAAEVPAAGGAVAKPATAAGAAAARPRAKRAAPAAKAGPRAASDKGPAKPRVKSAKPRATGATPRAAARPTPAPAPPAPEVPAAGYATGSGGGEDGGTRPGTGELVTTALQAVGEIAQLGAAVGQQAVRSALRRIPRP